MDAVDHSVLLANRAIGAEDTVLVELDRMMRALHFFRRADPSAPWADIQLTLPQVRVLGLLASHPRGLSGREIAHSLGVGPSAVSPLMDRLVEQGYVRREEDRQDRRVTRLFATPLAMETLGRLMAGRRERLSHILERLTPQQVADVAQAFALIADAARAIDGADSPGACATGACSDPQSTPNT